MYPAGRTSGPARSGRCDHERRTRPARRAAGVLRRRRDGDQGPGLDGAGVRAARLLLSRDRPQQDRRRALRAPRRGVRRRHRRGAARAARSCSPPTARHPRWSRRHAPAAASSSTRCARWSPRSTTRSRSAPARATASSTSATKATRRRSARWRWRRPRSVGSRRSPRSTPSPSSSNRWRCWPRRRCRTATGRASPLRVRERFPDVWTPGRSDLCFATTNRQSSLLAMVARCDAVVIIGSSNSSNTRALEKLAREAGCERGVPGQHRRPAARRSRRHGRRDRRRLGARGTRRRGADAARSHATASRSSRSPTRTSTSRRPATSATCRRRSRWRRRRCSAARCSPARRWTTAACRPATFWRRSESCTSKSTCSPPP